MYEFNYQRPGSLADVLKALASDDEAMLLAGGMTLIPSMKHRLAAPSQLLDIGRLPELQGISVTENGITVGAGCTHASVAASTELASQLPSLAGLARQIGDPQVRVRGTLGGSVANNDPAADYPAAVVALKGVVCTNRREIAADDFFQDMFTTALEAGEVILNVRFERPLQAAYAKFHHPATGYAMTGVFVARFEDGVRVAVTGAGPCVFRWAQAEQALNGEFSMAAVQGLEHPADGLNADMHAPAAYRANLVAVMTRRAVQTCEAD